MSATGSSREMARLRERRRQARRRRRLARLDVGLGVLGALVLIIATPGLAMTALIALLVLALCGVSVLLERRTQRRSQQRLRRRSSSRDPQAARSRRPTEVARR